MPLREESLTLFGGVAGETYTELLEYLLVYFAKHYRRVHLASAQFRKFLERTAAESIMGAE